jgi:hypothetical protein
MPFGQANVEVVMAEKNQSKRRRSGSHFASPGSAPHTNWGSERDRKATSSHSRGSSSSRSSRVAETAEGPTRGSSHLATSTADELNPYDSSAPRAVPTESASSFDTIAPGEGAVVTTRDTASEAADAARSTFHEQGTSSMRLTGKNRPHVKQRSSGGAGAGRIAVIVIVIALVFGAAVVFFRSVLNQPSQEDEESTLVTEGQVDVGEGFDYGGYTYSVTEQGDGTYALVRESEGDSLVLMQLSGTPVTLIFSNGVFYVPENTSSGWDIMCYTLGDGSMPTQFTDADGNPVGGSELLDSATYSDGTITCKDEGGQTTTVQLDS